MTNSVESFKEDRTTKREAIYSRFEAFEKRLAHCYFLLQERFIAEPVLSKKTADEIEELLDTVTSILSNPEVSVDEAFYAALLMESSELEQAYGELTSALAKDDPLLYEAIHASLRSHHERFAEAAETFCGDRGFVGGFRDIGKVSHEMY